jgi:hypothetical protein
LVERGQIVARERVDMGCGAEHGFAFSASPGNPSASDQPLAQATV